MIGFESWNSGAKQRVSLVQMDYAKEVPQGGTDHLFLG